MVQSATSSERRAQLSTAKRALLEQRLQGILTPKAPTIPQRPDLSAAPLSYAQERLWFRDRWEPGSPAYNRPVAVRLSGPLDVSLLEQALSEIVRRHETLRATFPIEEGKPLQVIAPYQALTIPVVDLKQWPRVEREDQARRLAAMEAQRPFSLADGPLLRATLLQLDPQEHVLLLVVHHIVFDGWSAQVLFQELAALYTAFSTGASSPLPKLPIQYTDFAYWQRQQLQGEVLESELAYWDQQLGSSPHALELPTDQPRQAVATFQGARQSLGLPRNLADALRTLSQEEDVTLYMSLLAAFQALLVYHSGQEDIIVCTPVANREQVELEGLIGYFNNIIVMRTDLSGDPSFREILDRVRRVVMGAYDHQNLPFQKLAELPDLAQIPLSRALFALQNFPSDAPPLQGMVTTAFDFDKGATDFELSLFVEQRGDDLTGMLEHKTDLFNASTANRMLDQFQQILERAVGAPELRLSALLSMPELEPRRATSRISADSTEPEGQHTPSRMVRSRPRLDVTFVEPRTDLERRITEIWEEVLGVQPIGIRDSFFDLGGNSLLAMRLFAQIEGTCGSVTSLSTFFQTPTIEQIARILQGADSPALAASEEESEAAQSEPMRDSFWRGLRNRLLQVIALYAPGFKTTRVRLHQMRGVKIGDNVAIGTSVIIETAYPQLVSIGNNVSISMRSLIVAHFRESTDKAKSGEEPSVRIEDDVYIGAGAIILPNLTIGQGAVVTAGSVVSQSVPPLTMVQGNPAKPVAHCGVPLAGSTYEDFVRNLRPIVS